MNSSTVMLKKIKEVFGMRNKIKSGTKIVISAEKLETRVALLEKGVLEEHDIERVGHRNIVGSIYKGRVKNIEQGLKAMFVDIGLEKNAFLHFWDAIPAALDSGLEEIQRGNKKKKPKKRITAKDIPDIYPVGSEVLVQITKGPVGNKGPRVTTNISMPGRFMVLMPLNDQFGISRKIADPKERKRLRQITENLSIPEGMGIIMRTVCEGKRARFFVRDLGMLLDQWEVIDELNRTRPAPFCAFDEPDLIEKTVRDFLTEDIEQVFCDDLEVTERMWELASTISRRAKKRIQHYSATQPIFEKFGVQRQIDDAFRRQVWLPCGGYLVFDETEAMITVDVNTGRNKGAKDVDKMIYETNMESAEEVARQLRLRNIGGLVVVDFIDMKSRKDQQAVYRKMRERLAKDKAKTQVLPISQLGLMEMTRQRLAESLNSSVYDPCDYCEGRGRLKSTMTMSVELQRSLAKYLKKTNACHNLIIMVHPKVMDRLRTEDDQILVDLERRHQARITFRTDPNVHREQILVADADTQKEIKL